MDEKGSLLDLLPRYAIRTVIGGVAMAVFLLIVALSLGLRPHQGALLAAGFVLGAIPIATASGVEHWCGNRGHSGWATALVTCVAVAVSFAIAFLQATWTYELWYTGMPEYALETVLTKLERGMRSQGALILMGTVGPLPFGLVAWVRIRKRTLWRQLVPLLYPLPFAIPVGLAIWAASSLSPGWTEPLAYGSALVSPALLYLALVLTYSASDGLERFVRRTPSPAGERRESSRPWSADRASAHPQR